MKELDEILEDAIAKSMEEIKDGKDSDLFKDLTIFNFLIMASRQGYEDANVLREYIEEFKYEDIIEEDE